MNSKESMVAFKALDDDARAQLRLLGKAYTKLVKDANMT